MSDKIKYAGRNETAPAFPNIPHGDPTGDFRFRPESKTFCVLRTIE